MVTVSDGVIKDVPVASAAPPVAVAYQLIVPEDAVAFKVTVPLPQFNAAVVPVMVGIGSTTTAKVLVEKHPNV